MSKIDRYKEFHQELAGKYQTTERVISEIRKLNRGGSGLLPVQMKRYIKQRIEGRNDEIAKMLAHIKLGMEVIDYLEKTSLETLSEMLEIQSGIVSKKKEIS